MKQQLSFATLTLLSDEIAEIIIDDGIEVSIEMLEECDEFLHKNLKGKYALLFNKINHYTFAFEAKMIIASSEHLQALAVVVYNADAQNSVEELQALREIDGLNIQVFSGLQLGWQKAHEWLQDELNLLAQR